MQDVKKKVQALNSDLGVTFRITLQNVRRLKKTKDKVV